MDPRKQKRLGPAPIASFEKSFEDSSSVQATGTGGGVEAAQLPTIESGQPGADFSKDTQNGDNSDVIAKLATMTSKSSSTSYKDTGPQSDISSSTVESGISPGNSNNATAVRNPTKSDSTMTKRAPPLKALAANPATTTLVSSCEQQVVVFKGQATLMTPATPRIELSRASSSSHQEEEGEDSRESSPENVFEQVGTGTLQESIELGFREEGALELRSSTEELFFMDPVQKKEEQEKVQHQPPKRTSPHTFKFDDHQNYLQQHQRKDSASSEVAALLCISGRSSRISSVGSQGSAVSHLSAISGVSRSPSPHRMLLETSFCGPKSLQNVVDGRVVPSNEPPTTELLEQMLLSRRHDPTQVILAEGIRVESSPKKKPTSLSNGDAALTAKIATQNRPSAVKSSVMGAQRRSSKSPGQMVVGKTPSGTEYIRINLKPDHMYEDKGIAPHERVVEAPNTLQPAYARGQQKPGTLSLGNRNTAPVDANRLTATASPKPTRHGAVAKDAVGSRSPSPAMGSVSRKSSFSSIFRLGGKDSPDSPRDHSRPRSKSKDRQKPQSQNATPSKQKSVLAIFTTGKRGSSAGNETKSSKSSSPIEGHDVAQSRSRQTPVPPAMPGTGSRPPSRLRYYDEPVEGVIHIPLHTPPEEKETRKLLESIQQLNAPEPPKQATAAITPGQLAAAAAALRPISARKGSGGGSGASHSVPPPPPPKPQPKQIEKVQRAENLNAIHSLALDDDSSSSKERSWSLEGNRHSSQDSHSTAGSDGSFASAIRVAARSYLAHVKESLSQETDGTTEEASAEVHRLPSEESTGDPKEVEAVAIIDETHIMAQQRDLAAAAKEKRRMLFATRLGSGSQEQVFSTQFSISKTESQSSQLSEKGQPSERTIFESSEADGLQRHSTVVRRTDSEGKSVKSVDSTEVATIQGTKSISTSEDEKSIVHTTTTTTTTTVSAVVIRRKESSDELRQKSTSDDDANLVSTQRHSRYLENFDVRKKYQENVQRKPKRQSTVESSKPDSEAEGVETEAPSTEHRGQPTLPQPPPPASAPSPSPPPKHARGSRSPTPPPQKGMPPRSQSQSPEERSRQTPTKPPRTTTPTRRTQQTPTASPPSTAAKSTLKTPQQPDRQSNQSTDEPIESSESERDSELTASTKVDATRHHLPRHMGLIEDHESTGLVSQESFDDELPYVPTTLPEERAHGVSLIPMKERANMELKTCPVDRPRSTTPLNPSHLEEYCGITTPQELKREPISSAPVRGEKLRISLPRRDSAKDKPSQSHSKSPRRASASSGKSWFEFAEEGLRATGGNLERRDSNKQLLQQQQNQRQPQQKVTTPLRGMTPKISSNNRTPTTTTVQSTRSSTTSTQRKLSGHWIDFENIPEKRKPPKRITTLPKDTLASSASRGHHGTTQQPMQQAEHTTPPGGENGKALYNYVKPEDCQCECHEAERESSGATTTAAGTTSSGETAASGEKTPPNAEQLQHGEDLLPLLDSETHELIEPSDSSREYSYYTDDEMDVPMHHSGSSRSKSSSSKLDEFPRRDKSPSPRNRRFPDFRKK